MATRVYEVFCKEIDDRSFAVFHYRDRNEDADMYRVGEYDGETCLDWHGDDTTSLSEAKASADKLAKNADEIELERQAEAVNERRANDFGGGNDSAYRESMIDAGRGHLLK